MYIYNHQEKRFEINWDCLFVYKNGKNTPIKKYIEEEIAKMGYTSIEEALEKEEEFLFDVPLKTNKYNEGCNTFQDYDGMYTLLSFQREQVRKVVSQKGFDFSPNKSVICSSSKEPEEMERE